MAASTARRPVPMARAATALAVAVLALSACAGTPDTPGTSSTPSASQTATAAVAAPLNTPTPTQPVTEKATEALADVLGQSDLAETPEAALKALEAAPIPETYREELSAAGYEPEDTGELMGKFEQTVCDDPTGEGAERLLSRHDSQANRDLLRAGVAFTCPERSEVVAGVLERAGS